MTLDELPELASCCSEAAIIVSARSDIRDLIYGVEDNERKIPFEKREKTYKAVLEAIQKDPSLLPEKEQTTFFDTVTKISDGLEITKANAEAAIRILGEYVKHNNQRSAEIYKRMGSSSFEFR